MVKYTTIRLTEKTVLELKGLQHNLSETYEDLIINLIKDQIFKEKWETLKKFTETWKEDTFKDYEDQEKWTEGYWVFDEFYRKLVEDTPDDP